VERGPNVRDWRTEFQGENPVSDDRDDQAPPSAIDMDTRLDAIKRRLRLGVSIPASQVQALIDEYERIRPPPPQRCEGTNYATGLRCERDALPGESLCRRHRGARRRLQGRAMDAHRESWQRGEAD